MVRYGRGVTERDARVDPSVLAELRDHGGRLVPRLVRTLERLHANGEPGVSRETVLAYAEALGVDREEYASSLDERIVDDPTWRGADVRYRVGDNVSAYPASWHERLRGTEDMRTFVEVVGDGYGDVDGGVSRAELLTAAQAIADIDRERGAARLKDQRLRGLVDVHPDEDPDATVYAP